MRGGGGGGNTPAAKEIGCHFSENDSNVLKLPDFFKNDDEPRLKESFVCISWMTVNKIGRVCQKPTKILRRISKKSIFFIILINKPSNFWSILNHGGSGNFFEVLHASLAQKLTNLEFSTMIFCDVAIGHFIEVAESKLMTSATSLGCQMKAKYYSFHMTCQLLM